MTGRNDLCPCGSGKKYKKCCLKTYDHFETAKFIANGLKLAYEVENGLPESTLSVSDKVDIFLALIGIKGKRFAANSMKQSLEAYGKEQLEIDDSLTAQEIYGEYVAEPKFQALLRKLEIEESVVWEIAQKVGAK